MTSSSDPLPDAAGQQSTSPGADPRIEAAGDAITYHPGNRTGTPDTRHPISLLLASAVLIAADAADRAAGIVRVDTRDEATEERAIQALMRWINRPDAAMMARAVLAALQGEQ